MKAWLPRLVRGRGRQGAADVRHSPYVGALLDEVHRFIVAEYGERALPREQFLALFWRLQQSGQIRPVNRFIGDLWNLFAPDFRDRLDEYYKSQELQLTMTFLAYAAQPQLLHENYVVPYQMMCERLPRTSVLEVGGGIPHGFLSQSFVSGTPWCESLTVVELDALYTRFVRWYCESRGVAFRHVPAHAGRTPDIPVDRTYGFVFAKDVLEHLDDPAKALRQIVAVAAPEAILALDLEDKGAVEYQHISPGLAALRVDVERAGFRVFASTGNMTMFERRS
jgi:2-polyprenyl-3-methyl-5-hydroxy-6-metoxy-1,4-benzoquinol methylase